MYKILGADSREYGPVTAEQLITWINEGRANGATLVQAEGAAEWKPLSAFPEFAEALRGKPTPPPPISPSEAPAPGSSTATAAPTASPAQLTAGDYRLEIGECISRSWDLYKENFGLLFGACAIFLLIQFVITGLSVIPFVGVLFSIANLFIIGPLVAGLYIVFLRRFRGQGARMEDLFSGFSNRYGQFLLAYIVPTLLTWVAIIPGAILLGIAAAFAKHSDFVPLVVILLAVGSVVMIIPAIYFGISWMFTLPLVLEKRLDFWPAMQVSRKMTGKHFFSIFGLTIVSGLISLVGFLACGIGMFFTFPIGFGAIAFAYLTVFGEQPAATLPTGSAPMGGTIPPGQQA